MTRSEILKLEDLILRKCNNLSSKSLIFPEDKETSFSQKLPLTIIIENVKGYPDNKYFKYNTELVRDRRGMIVIPIYTKEVSTISTKTNKEEDLKYIFSIFHISKELNKKNKYLTIYLFGVHEGINTITSKPFIKVEFNEQFSSMKINIEGISFIDNKRISEIICEYIKWFNEIPDIIEGIDVGYIMHDVGLILQYKWPNSTRIPHIKVYNNREYLLEPMFIPLSTLQHNNRLVIHYISYNVECLQISYNLKNIISNENTKSTKVTFDFNKLEIDDKKVAHLLYVELDSLLNITI